MLSRTPFCLSKNFVAHMKKKDMADNYFYSLHYIDAKTPKRTSMFRNFIENCIQRTCFDKLFPKILLHLAHS